MIPITVTPHPIQKYLFFPGIGTNGSPSHHAIVFILPNTRGTSGPGTLADVLKEDIGSVKCGSEPVLCDSRDIWGGGVLADS